MKSLKCAFDIHKWTEDKAGMENVCERCGIKMHEQGIRIKESYWYGTLRFFRSFALHPLCDYITVLDKRQGIFPDNKVIARTFLLRMLILVSVIKTIIDIGVSGFG